MIKIDRDKCDGCGVCIEACPQGAIRLRKEKAEIEYQRCLECGACIDICSAGAIHEAVPQFAGAYQRREVNDMMIAHRFCGRGFGMGFGRGLGRGMGMGYGRGFGRGRGLKRSWWGTPYAGYYNPTPPYSNYGYRIRPRGKVNY